MQVASMKANRAWGEQLKALLLENVEAIAEITGQGGIAMLIWHPFPKWAEGLKALGWDGEAKLMRMPTKLRRALKKSDSVTKRWVSRKGGPSRVFVINGPGSVLLNIGRDGETRGIWVEPGSTDHEMAEELGNPEEPLIVLEDEKMWGFNA